jgi:hypothetical protein
MRLNLYNDTFSTKFELELWMFENVKVKNSIEFLK